MNLLISFIIIGIIIVIIFGFFGEKIHINFQWIIGSIYMIIGVIYSLAIAVHLVTF